MNNILRRVQVNFGQRTVFITFPYAAFRVKSDTLNEFYRNGTYPPKMYTLIAITLTLKKL